MAWDELLYVVIGLATADNTPPRTVLVGAYPGLDEAHRCIVALPLATKELVPETYGRSLFDDLPVVAVRPIRTVSWTYTVTTVALAPPPHRHLVLDALMRWANPP